VPRILTRGSLVAGRHFSVAEVAAARALQKVPADRGHVAQLRRGARQQCLTQERDLFGNRRVGRKRLHRGQSADIQSVLASGDPAQRQTGDVDQPLGGDHGVLQHQVDLRRAPGEILRLGISTD
jgi:hypothetical protein